MKSKLFIATAAALAVTISAFAKTSESANAFVARQLKDQFKGASEITWSSNAHLKEASFVWNGQKLHAFYNDDNQQVALSREISEDKLPLKAQQAIAEKYSGYTTTEAIEYNSEEDGLSYYVSLEKDNKKVILNVSPEGSVSVFK
jgi:hypothetical protein